MKEINSNILSDITVHMKYAKYGTTRDEERTTKMKGLMKYLIDIQEELMDAILYIQTAQEELKEFLDEKET